MPQARGSSDYVRQLKNRAIAASYTPKQGISLDASTLLAARVGQLPQVFQPIAGKAYDVAGCCCAPPEEVAITVVAPFANSTFGYNWETDISWEDNGATYYSLTVSYDGSDTDPHIIVENSQPNSYSLLSTIRPTNIDIVVISHKPCGTSTTVVSDIF